MPGGSGAAVGCGDADDGLSRSAQWVVFPAKHVKGVANTLADGVSRWDRDSISAKLTAFRPDVNWQDQLLGEAGKGIITDVVASSTSTNQLRTRKGERTSRVADFGTSFTG